MARVTNVPSATWHQNTGQWGEWHCVACGEPLAAGAGYTTEALRWEGRSHRTRMSLLHPMVALGRRDGLPTFGLAPRVMAGPKEARSSIQPSGPHDLPALIYCPRRRQSGRPDCGKLQIVRPGRVTVDST